MARVGGTPAPDDIVPRGVRSIGNNRRGDSLLETMEGRSDGAF